MRIYFLFFVYLFLPALAGAQTTQLGLRVPKDFEVSEYASSELANDIYTLTVDPKGRIVVAGRGYIRILVDDNGDGRADRAIPFAETPKDGAMGMLWEKDTLYVTGDGGLRRFRDKNGDDRADGPSELIRKMKTGGEHTAHAIRRGPDGWLYVLCGNHAGIDKSYADLPTSPIKEPIGGCVLRFAPDLKKCEIVAHGFRNPYGMDFNPDGELFAYDSDNERCVSLPWYEPTRFYHVIPGGFYGWLSPQRANFWRYPPYFLDVVAPVTYLDRGSPTGVACYRHVQFPKKYRGGMFACDWTFGRVWFLKLIPHGSTYKCKKEIFIQSVGDNGFAPTGIVVHPTTGDVFISIGGRGTRGAVYRVRYKKAGEIDAKAVAALQPKRRKVQRQISRVQVGRLDRLTLHVKDSADDQLHTVRRMQLALGNLVSPQARGTVWEGYTLFHSPKKLLKQFGKNALQRVTRELRRAFPSQHADLDRELSRTLAALEDDDPKTLGKVAAYLTKVADPVEQIHYLIVLARLPAKRNEKITKITADVLLSLEQELEKRERHTDSHWPLRMTELYRELAKKDSRLNDTMLSHPEFGRAEHALYADTPGFERKKAARRFLQKAEKDEHYRWNAQVVELVGTLPAQTSFPVLRKIWGQAGLESAILPILAQQPQEKDRDKFITGLKSARLGTVRTALHALEKLPAHKNGQEILSLLLAMKRFPEKQAKSLQKEIGRYLQKITGQNHGDDSQAWTAWFSKTHSELAKRLTNPDGVDLQKWSARLSRLHWSKGRALRGRLIFNKAGCIACHSGRQALGPDLNGVANRFSRDDLLKAILQPSRDVPPRYQATLIETTDGKVYQGLVIYQATDGVILQTGAAETVRLPGERIASQTRNATSLMPAGLLENLSDREIIDLYAYLRSLKAK